MKKILPPLYFVTNFEKVIKDVCQDYSGSLSKDDLAFIEVYKTLSLDAKILMVRLSNSIKMQMNEQELSKFSKDCDLSKAKKELNNLNFLVQISKTEVAELFSKQLMQTASQSCLFLSQNLVPALIENWIDGVEKKQLILELEASGNYYFAFKFFSKYFEYLFFDGCENKSSLLSLHQLNDITFRSSVMYSDRARADWLIEEVLYKGFHKDSLLMNQLADVASRHSMDLIKVLQSKTVEKLSQKLWDSQIVNCKECSRNLILQGEVKKLYKPLISFLKRTKSKDLDQTLKIVQIDISAESETQFQKSGRTIELPHGMISQVEKAVAENLSNDQTEAQYVENRVWRMLFALTFWNVYFEKDEQGNLYHHEPTKEFYLKNVESIEKILTEIADPEIHKLKVLKTFLSNYKKPQKFFRWSNKYLKPVLKLIEISPRDSVLKILRMMLNDFKYYSSGYPDIISMTAKQIEFFEVKASGDKLSSHQLDRMQELIELGYPCEIINVEWIEDTEQSYVILDVETTGGLKGRSRITEIGAVKVRNGKVIDTFKTLINPNMKIPSAIVRLTGITDKMVQAAPQFREIANSLRTFLEGSIFVAHHVRFDYGFIQKEFRLLGEDIVLPTECTVALSRKKFLGLKSYSLKNLCAEFKISLDNHHRAFDDALAAAQVFAMCMGYDELRKNLALEFNEISYDRSESL